MRNGQPDRAPSTAPTMSVLKLLVVEDDDSVRAFVSRILLQEGFSVLGVRTLAEAHEALERAGNFDLVIADWELPDGKGYELEAVVGADRLLVTSGHARSELGAAVPETQAFIAKPYIPEELLENARWLAARLS